MSAARHAANELEERIWNVLRGVPDPEIPLVSIVDLGIVRQVAARPEGVEVALTPTYSGCPATDVIRQQVEEALELHGIAARIRMIVSPAWTTEWISAEGRRKLASSGIAPPRLLAGTGLSPAAANEEGVACPQCRSMHTERVSEFGSTPCKSLYRCRDCLEPFERFKCL